MGSLFCLTLLSQSISATGFIREKEPLNESLLLHIDGLSYHFASDRSTLNEENWGLGFSYKLGRIESKYKLLNNVKVFAETDVYSDSFSQLAYLFGATFQKKFNNQLEYGINIGLIHEENLQEKSDLYLHPYIFPYLQTNFNTRFNARFSFVPPVQNEGIVTLQLITRF